MYPIHSMYVDPLLRLVAFTDAFVASYQLEPRDYSLVAATATGRHALPAARDDYLLRMISQAAAALARLRARLAGGSTADEIVREIRVVERELLGPRGDLLRSVDAATAAQLLGTPEAVQVWAGLLRLEADALRASGNEAAAAPILARAAELEKRAPAPSRSARR